MGGGNDEREQTLNQLLTEMDGDYDTRQALNTLVQKQALTPAQQIAFTRRFGIRQVPALVSQDGLRLRIDELGLP